ncbi:MAG: MATE family efflux transporter, partial [Clostridiales bacterium]|nr:MATE family efflux transporter [Clostridiales bacterium]
MDGDLTRGPVMWTMLRFALPMILGNLLQQGYNVADTLIVGRFLGPDALAAVGSAFTLMTFLTSIFLGLCMGSGAVFSIRWGRKDEKGLQEAVCVSFVCIAAVTLLLHLLVCLGTDGILLFLRTPEEVEGLMRSYLTVIFFGLPAAFLYNYFASLLRALGNSVVPLVFLTFSAVLNILLDIWFVVGLGWGVGGAAAATVVSQYVAGTGMAVYTWKGYPSLRFFPARCRFRWACIKEIAGFSLLTCVQQSVMNFGILLVQGLVNSFGPAVMAAFAAAVKIDAFAYMPVQDFGNAFST